MQFKTTSYFIAAAVACAIAFVMISNATVVPLVAKGSGADGVQVTSSGWFALLFSALATSGFTLAGVVAAIVGMVSKALGVSTNQPTQETATELIELTASFAALTKTPTNKASQRRFVFALADCVDLVPGLSATHDSGVLVIRYDGFATVDDGSPKP